MAQAASISLSKFTATVQGAVKAAVAKHPKFRMEAPTGVTVLYLIRGIPVPELLLSTVTLGETQAFANEIAGHIAQEQPGAMAAAPKPAGAILSVGGHIVIGIPPMTQSVLIEK